jgi:hypothetical protein
MEFRVFRAVFRSFDEYSQEVLSVTGRWQQCAVQILPRVWDVAPVPWAVRTNHKPFFIMPTGSDGTLTELCALLGYGTAIRTKSVGTGCEAGISRRNDRFGRRNIMFSSIPDRN